MNPTAPDLPATGHTPGELADLTPRQALNNATTALTQHNTELALAYLILAIDKTLTPTNP
jgi:hypothetical protein